MVLVDSPAPSSQGCQGRGAKARRQNAQTSSVLTGCVAEGGAQVQVVLTLAPHLCWSSPKCHSGKQFQNGNQQDKNPDILLDADTGEGRGLGPSGACLLSSCQNHTMTGTERWGRGCSDLKGSLFGGGSAVTQFLPQPWAALDGTGGDGTTSGA